MIRIILKNQINSYGNYCFGNSKKKIIDYLKSNKFDNNDLFFTSLDDSEIFNEILDEFKIKHANVNLNNNINIISEIINLYDNIYEQNNIFLWLSTTVGSKVFKKINSKFNIT